jgi:beta-glucosidase
VTRLTLPLGFRFGALTSADQVEDAARADGRGESIWDRFSDTPARVAHDDNGDVTSDHDRRWAEDVALVARFGLWDNGRAYARIVADRGFEATDTEVAGVRERVVAP